MNGGLPEDTAKPLNSPGAAGRTVFEALVYVIIFFTLLLVAVERYYSTIKPVREQALVIELANMRTAVVYFAMLNGRLPESLNELATKDAIIKKRAIEGDEYRIIIVGKFVQSMTMDQAGNPTDPFGNVFGYDKEKGRVYSSTAGYERW
ncbi:MAG: hypothetical protein AABY51_03900 [Deltaproteobacteria bacterium]